MSDQQAADAADQIAGIFKQIADDAALLAQGGDKAARLALNIPIQPANPGQIMNNMVPAGKIVNEPASQIVNESGYVKNNQIGSIPLYGEVDGYTEHFTTQDAEAVRYFDVPWDGRWQFLQTMLGYSTNKMGIISRTLPDNHPEAPWLFAVDYEMQKGMGAIGMGNSSLIAYFNADPTAAASGVGGVARIKLIYRPLDFEVYSDADVKNINSIAPELCRFVTRDSDYAVQNLPLPEGANLLKFAEGPGLGLSIANGAGVKIFPTREVVYIWHDVPDVPDNAIDLVVGTVNAQLFDDPISVGGQLVGGYGTPANGGFPAGTLLCMAPKKKRTRNVVGRVQHTLTYRYLYRPTGWNYFPYVDKTTGAITFYRATFNGNLGGKFLYDTGDFNSLFTQPSPGILYLNANG